MDKILIIVYVPLIDEKFEIFIPINKKIGNIIGLVSKIVSDMSGGYFVASEKNSLYSGDTGDEYPIDVLVIDTDIRNGSKLILMWGDLGGNIYGLKKTTKCI